MNLDEVVIHRKERDRIGARGDDRHPTTVELETFEIYRLVARVVENEGMTRKRQCHARERGHPDLAARAGALDSRLRGNDTTLI
jgi:hypothetical protein